MSKALASNVVLAAVMLAVVGCGSSNTPASSSTSTSTPNPAAFVASRLNGLVLDVGKVRLSKCQPGGSTLYYCDGYVQSAAGLLHYNALAVYNPDQGSTVYFLGNGIGSPSVNCPDPQPCIKQVEEGGQQR
jgi:hypothetical protein